MMSNPVKRLDQHSFEFDNFDEFNQSIKGWSTMFRQVDRGIARVRLRHRMTPDINALDCQFTHGTKSFGATQSGHRTFGMMARGDGCTWCGHEVSPGQVLRFDAHEEFDTFTPSGFFARTISVQEDLLETIATQLGFDGFGERLDRFGDVLQTDPDAMRRFCRIFDAQKHSQLDLLATVEELIMLIESGGTISCAKSQGSGARYVDTALAFMVDHAHQAITVARVCEYLGVSYRTLDRAFKERLGHGPKESILAIRLNGVKQQLLSGRSDTLVADVANSWGFWHMGDFARVYRNEFGELPHETLSRVRVACLT